MRHLSWARKYGEWVAAVGAEEGWKGKEKTERQKLIEFCAYLS